MPAKIMVLSLTGPNSHTLELAAGQGNLVIGPPNPGGHQPHVVVEPDDRIDWSVFDEFTVPAGYPWPRFFTYRGNDTAFLDWSAGRPIERFAWTPAAAVDVDASKAQITDFSVVSSTHPVTMVVPSFPEEHRTLSVAGDPSLFRLTVAEGATGPAHLTFGLKLAGAPDGPPYRLPDFPALTTDARIVAVSGEPLGQAIDAGCLTRFPHVRAVRLTGNVTGLAALLDLPELAGLTLQDCPDLSSMPPLASFANLTSLAVSNVEEVTGKRLRSELRALMKTGERTWEHSWVEELRRPHWFVTEYGLPFGTWPAKAAKLATKAFRTAAGAVAASTTIAGVEAAVREFTRTFNTVAGIDTAETEDLGDAARLLAKHAPIDVAPELAESWFDAERDY